MFRARSTFSLLFGVAAAAPGLAGIEQEAFLTPADPLTSDIFGYDVSLDGTVLVSGAPFAAGQEGRAYVFEYIDGIWTQVAKLAPTTEDSSWVGVVTAASGETVAVSAPGKDGSAANVGWVYVYAKVGGIWTLQATLEPDAAAVSGAGFGNALAMAGDTLLVTAPGESGAAGEFSGAVYVFERAEGVWSQSARLESPLGEPVEVVGLSAAISGDWAAAGTSLSDGGGVPDAGRVHILHNDGSGWAFVDFIEPPVPQTDSLFGDAVAMDGDTIVVGAPEEVVDGLDSAGSAYVFERSGDTWVHVATLSPDDRAAADYFGIDVDVESDTIAVGAYLSNNDSGTGSVYLYRRLDGVWTYDQEITGADLYGWRLDLSGDRIAVGVPFHLLNRGAVAVERGVANCPDLNGDGIVDLTDLATLLAHFGSAGGPEDGDIDGNGAIDLTDLSLLLAHFGSACGA